MRSEYIDESYAIQMKNITKRFGQLVANKNISLAVKKGSIHALIGENGAGKSTLMNQLFGLLKPTSGEIFINGKKVLISNPNDANTLGLSMVHQHFQLVHNHSIIENIILGEEGSKILSPINYLRAEKKLIDISKKYKLEINPNQIVKKTSVGVQQRIEILKMLYKGANILIFDEPTAMLTPTEIDGLLDLFLDLKKKSKTIIFISHKLNEIKKVADFATVIRKGKLIKSFKVKDTSIEKMAEFMVGRKMIPIKNKSIKKIGEPILSIDNISVKHSSNNKVVGLKDFSIDVSQGEIVAIAGVEGNGQLELVNAIFGLQKTIKGKIKIASKSQKTNDIFMETLRNNDVKARYKKGISFVPEDRYKYAMLQNRSIYINTILQTYAKYPFQKFGFLRNKPRNEWTKKIIDEFNVRGNGGGKSLMGQLSGGNQQKFIIGREMSRGHQLLILFQPTRGLDIGAIEFIHKKILEEKEKGNAILLVSYDLSEIMSLSDRIAVLSQGKLINISKTKDVSREKIGKWMAGVK